MRWLNTSAAVLLFLSLLLQTNSGLAQLAAPLTVKPACAVDPGPLQGGDPTGWSTVVISEVSGDAGQSDSVNDAIVELAGEAGTDISGWVVTNGEWAVILPTGTVMPDDGVFVLGCGEDTNRSSFSTSSSGLTCPDCDFPGLCLDFDVCASYYANPGLFVSFSFSTYSFTLDNGACDDNADGDQVMIFRPDGTPHDGIFWGRSDNIPAGGTDMTLLGGSSGDCGSPTDHISVQDGAYYLLGDNDENGVVNDVFLTHMGRKANGDAAVGVREMPLGNYDPDANTMTNAEEVCFVMPPMNDPSGVWIYAGCSPTSCNSVYMRVANSDGNHCIAADDNRAYALAPSHMDDGPRLIADPCANNDITAMTLDPSCALDSDWANNSAGSGGIPSSIDPVGASAQWGYSDHPNPGQPNDANSWDFTFAYTSTSGGNDDAGKLAKGINEIVVCEGGMIKFTLDVFNYQHIEPTPVTDGNFYTKSVSAKAGSFVVDHTGTVAPWDTYNPASSTASTDPNNNSLSGPGPTLEPSSNDGTTTMCFTSIAPSTPGVYNYTLVWDDFGGLGSGSTSTVSGRAGDPSSQHECYEDVVITLRVVAPIAYDCDSDGTPDGTPGTQCAELDCADMDPLPGTINVNDYIVNGSGDLTFNFMDLDDAGNNTSNTTGIFNIPDDGGSTENGYQIDVIDNSSCPSATLTILINDNCEEPPVCPSALDNTGTTADGAVCPGDMVDLCLNGTDLPPNGTICWYVTTDGSDPVMGDAANATATIGATASEIDCVTIPGGPAPPTGGPVINEVLYDPAGPDGSNACEAVEIAGTPGTDLSCFMLSDGDFVITFPVGTTIPADGFFVISSGSCPAGNDYDPAVVDLDLSTCGCTNGTGTAFNLTNSGEFVALFNPAGMVIDGIIFEEDVNGNSNAPSGQSLAVTNPAGCSNASPLVIPNIDPSNPFDDTQGSGNWDKYDVNAANQSIARDVDVTGDWSNPGGNSIGGPNAGVVMMPPDCIMYTVPDLCSDSPVTITIEGLINPITSSCTNANFNYIGPTSTFMLTCPNVTMTEISVDQCVGDGPVMIPLTLSGLSLASDQYQISYTINGGAQSDIEVAGDQTMATITIPDADTGGKLTVQITGVYNDSTDNNTQDVGECWGTANTLAESCITISPLPTAFVSGTTDFGACDGSDDGTVTIEFSAPGNYDIEYTVDDGSPILQSVTASGTPAVVTLDLNNPGTVELISVFSEAGCMATINAAVDNTSNPPPGITANANNPATNYCNDGSVTIDLTTETSFSGMPGGGNLTWHTMSPAGASPAALAASEIASGMYTIPNGSSGETVYYLYVVSGCEITGSVDLMASAASCAGCPVIGSLTDPGDICEGDMFDLTAAGLDDMAMADNGTADYGIDFVHYGPGNTSTTSGNAYMGGSSLGSVAFASLTGTDPNQMATIMNVGAGLADGTYEICAILTPTPADVTCQVSQCQTVVILPTPAVTDPMDQTVCAGDMTTAVTFVDPNGTAGVMFAWTNDNTSIGLAASGTGNIAAFAGMNATNSAITGTITVTPYTVGPDGADNGGMGDDCTGTPQMFEITILPTPAVTDPMDQTVCAGDMTSAVTFVDPNGTAGVMFAWTNDNTDIGLASSGTGNIAAFTGMNATNSAITGTITVTPYTVGPDGADNGGMGDDCTGTPQMFEITVLPTPAVTDPMDQTVCAGDMTTAVTFVDPNGTAGVMFAWTNDNTDIGLAASGTGNIAAFAGMNATNSAITGTITVTPYTVGPDGADNGGMGDDCTGTPQMFEITILPTPAVTDPMDQTVCAGDMTTAVTFVDPNGTVGVMFAWTNDNTSIGLAASGTGNIAAFAGMNATNSAITGTITVTPYTVGPDGVDNGGMGDDCTGTPQMFEITVLPAPAVADPMDQTVCAGDMTTAITFVDPNGAAGVMFTWTNDNTDIGLGASGMGNIAAFTGMNATNSPITGTITVTPYTVGPDGADNGGMGDDCTGTPQMFEITVLPIPAVTDPMDQTVCAGEMTTTVTFVDPNGTSGVMFIWSNGNTNIGLTGSGTGNIGAFTGTNAGSTPISGIITVTPYTAGPDGVDNNGGGDDCMGAPQMFEITVLPTPSVTDPMDQMICAGDMTTEVNFMDPNSTADVMFVWTNDNTDIGLGASGTGNIEAFTGMNATNSPITGTITVTPYTVGPDGVDNSGMGDDCAGTPQMFDITVSPQTMVEAGNNLTVCRNMTMIDLTSLGASISGGTTTGQWTSDGDGVFDGGGAFGVSTTYTLGTNDISNGSVSLTLTSTNSVDPCPEMSDMITITINNVDCGSFPWDGN